MSRPKTDFYFFPRLRARTLRGLFGTLKFPEQPLREFFAPVIGMCPGGENSRALQHGAQLVHGLEKDLGMGLVDIVGRGNLHQLTI